MSAGHQMGDGIPGVNRSALRFRRIVSAVCVGAMLTQMTACYTSVPVQATGAPVRGLIKITVNDHGRLVLGEKFGSLLDYVEGRITGSDDKSVQFVVTTTYDVRGKQVNWGGEPAVIPRDGISEISQRRVEKVGTTLILVGIVATIVGLYVGLHHAPSGSGDSDPGTVQPPINRLLPPN